MFHPELRPPRHRGAYCTYNVALLAGQRAGVLYTPPASGAVVLPIGGDAAATLRINVAPIASIPAFTVQAATVSVFPIWPGPNYRLSGSIAGGTFAAVPGAFIIAQQSVGTNGEAFLVMPGNLIAVYNSNVGAAAEGGVVIHEFLNPDDFEAFYGSKGLPAPPRP